MGSILKHPIYIDTGNLIYDSLILGRQTGFWYAKEINFRGISQNPIEEILKLLLTKKNDNGVNVVNITLSDFFRTLFFSKFRIKGLKLIKILYPSTYSLQENRMALFTVIVSSLALSISLYTVINNTTNSINNYNIIIPIIVFHGTIAYRVISHN